MTTDTCQGELYVLFGQEYSNLQESYFAMKNKNDPNVNRHCSRSSAEIEQWLIRQLAEELRIPREKIKVDQPILAIGIDSMQIVVVVAKLEDWLGIRFSSNPLDDHSTIRALSQFASGMTQSKQ